MNYAIIHSIKCNKQGNACLITLENGESFLLSLDLVARYKLSKGEKVERTTIQEILKEQRIIDAKNLALNYVSFKPRTSAQIEQKLRQKGYTKDEIQRVVQFLTEFGYLDDRTFVRNYVKLALEQKKHSLARIRQSLYSKGVRKELIEEVFNEFSNDEIELENAYKIGLKKYQQLLKQNKSQPLHRLAQYLRLKGFEWDIINKVCEKLEREAT